LLLQPVQLPEPHLFSASGLDETFLVHEGTIRAVVPLQIASNLGVIALGVDIRYQACTDSICYPPQALHLELALTGLDNVRPEPA
jgi:hypothetical protein